MMSCCHLQILQPKKSIAYEDKQYHANKRKKIRIVRSGTIILDFTTKKVLVIQSYQKYWGLPKGHKEDNESLIECAIRETKEETGIVLTKNDLIRCYSVYNGDGIYYIVNGTNLHYNISNINNKEEITGISWLCIDCLKKYQQDNEIFLNSHLKVLIPIIEKELNNVGEN